MGTNKTEISVLANPFKSTTPVANTSDFSQQIRDRVFHLHHSLPGYSATPLHRLSALAHETGVANIWIKDESHRFGLNAFKGLGASYAIANKFLANQPMPDLQQLVSITGNGSGKPLTLVTATDGNHGRAVAWMARLLNARSLVFMPFGSEQVRVEAIRSFGAEVSVIEGSYDDAVAQASESARNLNGVLVQDMAWDKYEEIPLWIMQGYTTLLTEIINQLGKNMPTHLFLQAGVGSFPAAIQAALIEYYGDKSPAVIIVEPDTADCFYRSVGAADGRVRSVEGHLETIMAGLACGTPSSLAWPIIQSHSDHFVKCSDETTRFGMRILAHPLGDDPKVVSGESGAVTTGLLTSLLMEEKYASFKETLSLGQEASILLISTEGDTDPDNYRRITALNPWNQPNDFISKSPPR